MGQKRKKREIEIFTENLGLARRARGYSQAVMAEKLGIARTTYSGYETGKRSPNVEMFSRISKALFVSADELLGSYDYGTPNLIRDARAKCFAESQYSTDDYFNLPESAGYELIEGRLMKKKAPGYREQVIIGQIFMRFYQCMREEHKKCEVIPAPFPVVLSRKEAVVAHT